MFLLLLSIIVLWPAIFQNVIRKAAIKNIITILIFVKVNDTPIEIFIEFFY